jgi:hypothetical protein
MSASRFCKQIFGALHENIATARGHTTGTRNAAEAYFSAPAVDGSVAKNISGADVSATAARKQSTGNI